MTTEILHGEIPEGYLESLVEYLGNCEIPLKGQVAIVTNIAEGAGPKIAAALARNGVKIIAIHAEVKKPENVIDSVEEIRGEIKFVDVDRLEAGLKESGGKVDMLILNGTGASVFFDKCVHHLDQGGRIAVVGESSWFGP